MSQMFQGAQPKVVKNKAKYNQSSASQLDDNNYASAVGGDAGPYEDGDQAPLNIMYDKRVFRGNTYNMNLLK